MVYSLGYGGDFEECTATFHSAAALVAMGGKVFETSSQLFMGETERTQAANACLESSRSAPIS